jgi:hypothetical protein
MKIRRIELDGSKPVGVIAELSIEEAAQIANWAGSTSRAGAEVAEIYNALAGDLFNRFWDAGIIGYMRGDDT